MQCFSRTFVTAAFSVLSLGAVALASPLDRPVASQGSGGPAPTGEGNPIVTPSFGTGSESAAEALSRGVTFEKETSAPATGLETVAYGPVGQRGRSIINWDSRTRSYTQNYPTRAIVYIQYNGNHHCTGFMYAPNMVATAGHCVHTGGSGGSWYDRRLMRVFAGKDGQRSPWGVCRVSRMHSVVGWTQNNNFRFDYAAMRLNCTIGNTVGWFGLYEHASPTNQPAMIGGYPGDKPRDQWASTDKIREFSAEMIAYRMDTVGGHSGSPIWHDREEGLAANGAYAFGIHNYGVGAFGTNANAAARLTSVRIQNYVTWRDAP